MAAIYLTRHLTNQTLAAIGKEFGVRTLLGGAGGDQVEQTDGGIGPVRYNCSASRWKAKCIIQI